MSRKILDLFCGAGGAAMGYHRAGFEVVGVDNRPQPHYQFQFVQADVFEFMAAEGWRGFDVIHASPPCQGYSITLKLPQCQGRGYKLLIDDVRGVLAETGLPYVIENVVGARKHMPNAIMLCGVMFGLRVFRHRLFDSNLLLLQPPHLKHAGRRIGENGFCCVVGHGDAGRGRINAAHRTKAAWSAAMGIDWMTKAEMTQAIPPAYTEWIGRYMLRVGVV